MNKVAIYCRLSEEDRNKQSDTDDSNSIANQKAMLLQYAAEQGWEVYQIYSDDDYAGADRNRPAFNRLIADAKVGSFDVVLCKTQSRFTRELELVETYIHGLFPLWGIRFVSIVDNADTANKGNKKARQINGLVNEWYLEDMSENIKSVLTNRRQNGFHIGSFALYGYVKDPAQKGHLLIDPEAAAVVREVFTLFSQGYGKTAIARLLNDRGIPNPTEYKRLKGLRYQQPTRKAGTLWTYAAISSMLQNELYIGNMVQGKYGSVSYKTKACKPRPKEDWYRVEGTHQAIIQRDLWERVQALLAQRAKPFVGGAVGLFSKKAICAHCGYAMRSSKSHGRHYLKCATRHIHSDVCIGSFVSVAALEQAVRMELRRLTDTHLNMEILVRCIERSLNPESRKERLRSGITSDSRRIEEQAAALRALYLDKAKGLISESEFVDLRQAFVSEKQRLKRALASAKAQLMELDMPAEPSQCLEARIHQYTHPQRLTRQMVEAFIHHIAIGKRLPGTRQVPVEIHWNF